MRTFFGLYRQSVRLSKVVTNPKERSDLKTQIRLQFTRNTINNDTLKTLHSAQQLADFLQAPSSALPSKSLIPNLRTLSTHISPPSSLLSALLKKVNEEKKVDWGAKEGLWAFALQMDIKPRYPLFKAFISRTPYYIPGTTIERLWKDWTCYVQMEDQTPSATGEHFLQQFQQRKLVAPQHQVFEYLISHNKNVRWIFLFHYLRNCQKWKDSSRALKVWEYVKSRQYDEKYLALLLDYISSLAFVSHNIELICVLRDFVVSGECPIPTSVYRYLVQGFAHERRIGEAFDLLVLMEKCKVGGNQKPFEISCRVLLSLCATMPSLYYGERVYELYQKQGFKNVMVEGAAMLMFGNCGELEQSKKIFENLKKDGLLAVIGWNTYIKCLTANSQYEEALQVFSELKEKIKPNSITIVAVLQACSYGGLVDAAREIWKEFANIRNIIMKSCMVDVLSRNGFLDEAESLLREEGTHDIFGLCSLLGACVNYKDLKRGLRIGHEIIQNNPNENFKTYETLIKLCEVCGENEEKMKIEALRKSNNPVKIIKKAEIEVDGKIHTFQQGNFSHPKSKEIRNKLHQVYQKLIKNGCDNLFPALWRTSPTLSTEAKINTMLYHHSEKVAICFGLISTPPGSVLRINAHDFPLHWRKHSAIKQIAKLYNRKILLRERSHVHCFTPDGECSCQDKPYQKAPEKQV